MSKRKRIEQLELMLLRKDQENKNLKKRIEKLEEKFIKIFKYKGYVFRQRIDYVYHNHYDYWVYDEKEKLYVWRYKKHRPLEENEIIELINKVDNLVKGE